MFEILTALVSSPALALLLLGYGIYIWRSQPRKAKGLVMAAFVVGWVLSAPITARSMNALLVVLIDGPMYEVDRVDLIVTPTAGMTYMGDTGWLPSAETFNRVAVAHEVQGRINSRIPILIIGGHSAGVKHPSEAAVVRNLFDRNWAQVTPVMVNETALNLYEGASETARLMADRGAQQILLVTSELEMPRALAAFRSRGVDPIPFPVFTLAREPLGLLDVLPSAHGAMMVREALGEILAISGYLVSGRVKWRDVFYTANEG